MLKIIVRQTFRLQPIFTTRLSISLCHRLHTLSNQLNKYPKNAVNNYKRQNILEIIFVL